MRFSGKLLSSCGTARLLERVKKLDKRSKRRGRRRLIAIVKFLSILDRDQDEVHAQWRVMRKWKEL